MGSPSLSRLLRGVLANAWAWMGSRPELRWQQVGLGAVAGCIAVPGFHLQSPEFLSVSQQPHPNSPITLHPTPLMEFARVPVPL